MEKAIKRTTNQRPNKNSKTKQNPGLFITETCGDHEILYS